MNNTYTSAEITNALSAADAWQLAGQFARYDSHWGTGPEKLFLLETWDDPMPDDFPSSIFDCFSIHDLYLEKDDEFKAAKIHRGVWQKDYGADALRFIPDLYSKQDDFGYGANPYFSGANIKVAQPGKYRIMLFVPKTGASYIRDCYISWIRSF